MKNEKDETIKIKIEDLEAVDQGEDRHEQDRGGKKAQLDAEKPVKRTGPVDIGRLQQVLGDIPQGRGEEDHIVAQVLPQKQDHRHQKIAA